MAVDDSARSIVDTYLAKYGLSALSGWAWETYVSAGGGDGAMAQIELDLPDQPVFQARFPAYKALQAKGHAMTVDQMLSYEVRAEGLMRGAGLPSGFYDHPDDYAALMTAEVSYNELQQRVALAQRWVVQTPTETKDAFKKLYGVGPGDLVAMALDPDVAQPLLEKRYVAAEISGIGTQAGFRANRSEAEMLAEHGVTGDQARQTFGELADQKGLFAATQGEQTAGEGDIGQREQIQAGFGLSPAARRRIEKRKEQRVAEFAGGSGYRPGREGVAGLAAGTT